MKKLLICVLLASASAFAQTEILGDRAMKGKWDASASPQTIPFQSGLASAIPGTCTVGQIYFATDGINGRNIMKCATTNTWTTIVYDQGTSVPGSCVSGQIFFKTDATAGTNLYLCGLGGTYTQMPGGNVVGPGTNHDLYIPQWNGANSNILKDGLPLVTVVGSPGVDTNVPTEKAVRDAVAAVGASGNKGTFVLRLYIVAAAGATHYFAGWSPTGTTVAGASTAYTLPIPVTGTITAASVQLYLTGTLGSMAAETTVGLCLRPTSNSTASCAAGGGTAVTLGSAFTLVSTGLLTPFYVSSLSTAVTAGDKINIEFFPGTTYTGTGTFYVQVTFVVS